MVRFPGLAGGGLHALLEMVAVLLIATAPAEKPKLIVLDLAAQSGTDAQLAGALTDSVTGEIASRGFFEVSTSRDVQTLIGVERQKQLLGCTEESCMSELAGAIGARFVLSGSVSKLGDAYQLNLQMLDTRKGVSVARSMHLAKDLNGLRAQLPYAVAEATGIPLPAPPSHTAPYVLMGAGGLLFAVGGLAAVSAAVNSAQYNSEIHDGVQTPAVLKTYNYYAQANGQLQVQAGVAIGIAAAGAALAVIGYLVNPSEPGSAKVALVPGPTGAALVATW